MRVDATDYVAVGNSTNKKDAQSNAARDFVNYLVRNGLVAVADVPADAGITASPAHEAPPPNAPFQQRPVFGEGMGPDRLGEAYRYVRLHTMLDIGLFMILH